MTKTAVWYVPLTPEQMRLLIDALALWKGDHSAAKPECDELIELLESYLELEPPS